MSPVEESSWKIPEDWSPNKFPGKLLTGYFLAVVEARKLQARAVGESPDVTC